ncbi:MAG: two-component system sensor histidine kinase NtrB [Limisphaerales bacterium]
MERDARVQRRGEVRGGRVPLSWWKRGRLQLLPEWLTWLQPDLDVEQTRLRTVERNLGLPVRAAMLVMLAFYFFHSHWFLEGSLLKEGVQEVVKWFFVVYVGCTVVAGVVIAGMEELPFRMVREVVLGLSVLDSVFLGALTAVTGGFDSLVFWVFVILVVRNSVATPAASRQILANAVATGAYAAGGAMAALVTELEISMIDDKLVEVFYPEGQEPPAESVILRVSLLVLLTACCYGVEVLFDRSRRLAEEARESAQRQHQLESAGRLAAEIAHQLKNPLGIINNAAFTLQRTVREGKTITQQIQIIREEVARSDQIITELMGYARLVEGKVERLDVVEELESAIHQVFPPAVQFEVRILRQYAPGLPALLAQRSHIAEVFLNIFQNAREAMQGKGNLKVGTSLGEGLSIVVTVEDDGPGIAVENLSRVFEAYFTTKEKGTGLGLSIVKHNTELYGGQVRLESELGKGTKFVLVFPARTLMRLKR